MIRWGTQRNHDLATDNQNCHTAVDMQANLMHFN